MSSQKQPVIKKILPHLNCLGPASQLVDVLFETWKDANFFDEFTHDDIILLARFMQVYQSESGQTIISEGAKDDYMLFILRGLVNIVKTDNKGNKRSLNNAGPGTTIGEMALIDGGVRFASCIALDNTIVSVLSRKDLVQIILEEPKLGAKILVKLVSLLSQRLRETSNSLMQQLERTETV